MAISQALLVGGWLLVAVSLVWAASTDLHPGLQLNCVLVGVTGALTASLGQRRLFRLRGVRRRMPIARLDADGIAVRTGGLTDPDLWARLAWHDLSAVVVRPRTIGPPLLGVPTLLPVVYFVAREDRLIEHGHLTVYDLASAAILETSPAAAAMTMLLPRYRRDVVEQIEAWLAANRPEVPFDASLPSG